MTPKISHALIMAAGRGRRMMPLTEAIPKPMAPYQDSTLIAHGIAQLRRFIPHIHVTVGYLGAQLAQHLITLGINSVFNTDGQNNAWWIANTLMRGLDQPVFVLTCDNITELDFDVLAADYFAGGSPACMLVPVAPIPSLEGDYIFHEGRIVTSLDRNRPAPTYCSGIQVLNPARVTALTEPADDFYAVWNKLIAAEQLQVSDVRPTHWFSVDTIADLDRLNEHRRP